MLDCRHFALREVGRLAGEGRAAFDASEDRQRALAYIWVTIDSMLKDYAATMGILPGHSPFTRAIRYRDRLAHQPLNRLDVEIVWDTSAHHAPELLLAVEQFLASFSDEE